VSPKKTIEGAIGGLVFSCGAALGAAYWLFPAGTYAAGTAIAGGLVIAPWDKPATWPSRS